MEMDVYKAELRALISIRNFGKALELHYQQLIEIEKQVEMIQANAIEIIQVHCSPQKTESWRKSQMTVTESVAFINETLKKLKEKVAGKDRSDTSDLWAQFNSQIEKFKNAYKSSEQLGLSILPESERDHWQKDICNIEDTILPLIISHAETCKMELELIQKYTPKELHKITKVIADNIPADFTYEDVDKYEEEYLKAVGDFENEFAANKNLWDKFLDVLAGGTHQPPSERVMLQRWVDGEKRNLK
jgi:hypothetical protein